MSSRIMVHRDCFREVRHHVRFRVDVAGVAAREFTTRLGGLPFETVSAHVREVGTFFCQKNYLHRYGYKKRKGFSIVYVASVA
jgi:hypothetical protein